MRASKGPPPRTVAGAPAIGLPAQRAASCERSGMSLERMKPGAGSAGWKTFRETSVPGNEAFRKTRRSGERGRRRTRQDQISVRALGPVKLRTGRSAPNEENLFLLPDRL